MPPRVLASEPKPCEGNDDNIRNFGRSNCVNEIKRNSMIIFRTAQTMLTAKNIEVIIVVVIIVSGQ